MQPFRSVTAVVSMVFSLLSACSGGPLDFEDICGTRPAYRPQTRIFNGRDAVQGSWPWLGLIQPKSPTYECMAVLIDEWWALTVPYCSSDIFSNNYDIHSNRRIVFGDTAVNGSSPYRQEVIVRREYTHPNSSGFQNDLQLLHFESPVEITDYVRPICLSQSKEESEDYDSCWVAGWGNNGPSGMGDTAPILQEGGSIKVLSASDCAMQLQTVYHETILCQLHTGQGEPRGCGADGAAPTMCVNRDGRWDLIGQLTGTAGVCGGNLVINNRISRFYDFFLHHIKRVQECTEPDLLCDDGLTCVLEEERCDAERDCPKGEDEAGCTEPVCNENRCSNGGTCREDTEGTSYICMCAERWEGRNCEKASCGETQILLSPGSTSLLQSPLFPEVYPERMTCEYTITAPQGYKVLVMPDTFVLQPVFDFLEMDNITFTGSSIPSNYTSVEEVLNIRFTSGWNRLEFSQQGFNFTLSVIDVTSVNECEWDPCSFDGECIDEDDGFTCKCVDDRLGRMCISADDYCGPENIYLNEGATYNLTSFHYFIGNKYQTPYTCAYKVTAPEGHRVRIQVTDAVGVIDFLNLLLLDNLLWFNAWPNEYISHDNDLEILFRVAGVDPNIGVFLTISDFLMEVDECEFDPCRNGGVCVDQDDGFHCKCRRGFSGKTCEIQTEAKRCGRGLFGCDNGRRCIKASSVCDGRNHCGDNSDERNCACFPYLIGFHCHNGRCIPERFVCDGANNCGDWTDELRPQCNSP